MRSSKCYSKLIRSLKASSSYETTEYRDVEFMDYLEQTHREILVDRIGLVQPMIQSISSSSKLSQYKSKKYYDARAPRRLPRFFKNGYLSPFCSKHAILNHLFTIDKLRKGFIADVNVDHTIFVDTEDFVVVNDRVVYPRYKLKIKRMSRAKLENGMLSFYYAQFDEGEKKVTLKLVDIMFANADVKALTKVVQCIDSWHLSSLKSTM